MPGHHVSLPVAQRPTLLGNGSQWGELHNSQEFPVWVPTLIASNDEQGHEDVNEINLLFKPSHFIENIPLVIKNKTGLECLLDTL